MRTLEFSVPGELTGKGSMRAYTYRRRDGGTGARMASSERAQADQLSVSRAALLARGSDPLFEGAIAVRIEAWILRPKSVRPARRPWPIVKPDADKLARLVLDALTRVLYADDAAVCRLDVIKRYAEGAGGAEGARVVVLVREL